MKKLNSLPKISYKRCKCCGEMKSVMNDFRMLLTRKYVKNDGIAREYFSADSVCIACRKLNTLKRGKYKRKRKSPGGPKAAKLTDPFWFVFSTEIVDWCYAKDKRRYAENHLNKKEIRALRHPFELV